MNELQLRIDTFMERVISGNCQLAYRASRGNAAKASAAAGKIVICTPQVKGLAFICGFVDRTAGADIVNDPSGISEGAYSVIRRRMPSAEKVEGLQLGIRFKKYGAHLFTKEGVKRAFEELARDRKLASDYNDEMFETAFKYV